MNSNHRTLTVMESNALLDALLVDSGTKRQKKRGLRNYLIGLLMLDAGLRVSEVCKLRRSHLLFNGESVTSVTLGPDVTKHKVERVIPLSQRIRKAISSMNNVFWYDFYVHDDHYAFFVSDPNFPLTVRQVQRLILQTSRRVLGFDVHPHLLRHTFATRLSRTTDIRTVQELLGHKHLASTQVYTHPSFQDLTKAIESLGTEKA